MPDAKILSKHTDGAYALLRLLNDGHEPYAPAVGLVQQWLANWEAQNPSWCTCNGDHECEGHRA